MRFLVHSRMVSAPSDEVFALFPAEQARIAELFEAGALEQLYVASDYGQAWLIINGATEDAAQQIATSLPLARFSERQITPLLAMV
jgi:muconolactone delta-isomerase